MANGCVLGPVGTSQVFYLIYIPFLHLSYIQLMKHPSFIYNTVFTTNVLLPNPRKILIRTVQTAAKLSSGPPLVNVFVLTSVVEPEPEPEP